MNGQLIMNILLSTHTVDLLHTFKLERTPLIQNIFLYECLSNKVKVKCLNNFDYKTYNIIIVKESTICLLII